MARLLGIDVGTTKIAALVLDTAESRVVGAAEAPTPGRQPTPAGRSEWQAAAIAVAAVNVARMAVASLDGTSRRGVQIEAIGVTGQMHGMLVLDPTGRPRTPLIGWQDRRADEPLAGAPADHPTAIAWLRHLAGPAAPERLGCRVASGFLGATLFWLDRTQQLPTGPGVATTMPDYLVAYLCDQAPITDPTNAAGTGLFNIRQREWDPALLAALDLPLRRLPPVRPTGSLAGRLHPTLAGDIGLPAGTPVLNALGDNQASFFGSVAHPDEEILVNVGTGGQVSAVVDLVAPPGLLETRPFIDDRLLLVGAGLAGGVAYATLHDFFRRVGQELFGVSVEDLYDRLNELAAAVPAGSDGLTCQPTFSGIRAEPWRRGQFDGLTPTSLTPGHLVRALLEGLADGYRSLADEMMGLGLAPRRRLIGAGNGVRRNPLLASVLADRFRLPLHTPVHTEEAAYGAAMLAAVASGSEASATIGRLIRYA